MEQSSSEDDGYEILYLAKQKQKQSAQTSNSSKKSAQSPSLTRHALSTSASTSTPSALLEITGHISVGNFYELDHSELPAHVPDQLRSIRVVMVSEKATRTVSLRFPSIHSVGTHLNAANYGKPEAKKLPALDEKYVMASDMASEALFRRIRAQELAEKRHLWNFWVAPSMAPKRKSTSPELISGRHCNFASKCGPCTSELKLGGMVQWGKRRRVRFLDRREEEYEQKPILLVEKEEENEDCGEDEEEEEEEEEGEEEEQEEEEKEVKIPKGGLKEVKVEEPEFKTYRRSKRKLLSKISQTRNPNPAKIIKTQSPKPAKRQKQKQNQQIVVYNRSKKKKVKDSIDRWSAARYKLAEENMLKIMKEKGAVFGKPVLRPALRSEARKLIGDTGLLDHLLKHMAGKVAPGGTDRFQRRHNADGAMEYWLEDANLVNIRREAGVRDPYWTPPPGWEPGDNPAQDPVCARELKEIREEMAKMKKEMQELESRKKCDDLIIATTPSSTLTCVQWNHENSAMSLEEVYVDLLNRKAKMEEQLKEISESLSAVEEQMGIMKSTMGEHIVPSESEALPALMGSPTTPSDNEREMRQKNQSALKSGGMREGDQGREKAVVVSGTEEKAARIKKLRSGFSICKPQGRFMWSNPSMTFTSPQLLVQADDPFVVSTPPSVSSSTVSAPPHFIHISQPQIEHQPTSPVKPFAEKRPVYNATLCAVSKPPSTSTTSPLPLPLSPETSTKTSFINLNEAPSDQQNHDTATCGTLTTYQRRNHTAVANIDSIKDLVAAKKEDREVETEKNMEEGWLVALPSGKI